MNRRTRRAGAAVALLAAVTALIVVAGRAGHPDPAHRWTELTEATDYGWRRLPVMPVTRYEAAAATVDGRLFVFGGFRYDGGQPVRRSVTRFDPRNGTWSSLGDLPTPVTHANAVVVGDTVWLAGGFVGDHPGTATAEVWRFDSMNHVWVAGPALPSARAGGTLARIGRTLHYVGGYLPDRVTSSGEHWTLPLDGPGTWSPAAPLPIPRGHAGGAVINGRLFLIGGAIGHDVDPRDTALVSVYDPDTDQWTDAAPLPYPLSHMEGATLEVDGRILVLGGRARPAGREATDGVLLYDPALDAWSALPPLRSPRIGAVAAVVDGILLIAGGALATIREPTRLVEATPLLGAWTSHAPVPVALGEVAAGIVGHHLYLVGQGDPATRRFDLRTGQWDHPGSVAPRPLDGHHHASEVLGGRWYLLGGLGPAAGAVQVYDPATNRWIQGAPMPFAAGSSASAAIGGLIFVAGGIVGDHTVPDAARYDPASDTWTAIAPMPLPRNHAASATDGRRLWVFGGRGPGSGDANVVANGYADVQVYEPAEDRWITSADPGSGLAPLPQARGGMGKAVWLEDRFWILGGETLDGPGATPERVYTRVDVFEPATGRWTMGPPMRVPRHGIFPVAWAGRIWVAAGGVRAARSGSTTFDALFPRRRGPETDAASPGGKAARVRRVGIEPTT